MRTSYGLDLIGNCLACPVRKEQFLCNLSVNALHHRSCENEATPYDVDIYFPPGNTDPKFHNIRRQVFCSVWQALYALDLELAHAPTRKKWFCGQSGARVPNALAFNQPCPHASLFDEAVFAEFLVFVGRGSVRCGRGLRIDLDVPALINSEILRKFHH